MAIVSSSKFLLSLAVTLVTLVPGVLLNPASARADVTAGAADLELEQLSQFSDPEERRDTRLAVAKAYALGIRQAADTLDGVLRTEQSEARRGHRGVDSRQLFAAGPAQSRLCNHFANFLAEYTRKTQLYANHASEFSPSQRDQLIGIPSPEILAQDGIPFCPNVPPTTPTRIARPLSLYDMDQMRGHVRLISEKALLFANAVKPGTIVGTFNPTVDLPRRTIDGVPLELEYGLGGLDSGTAVAMGGLRRASDRRVKPPLDGGPVGAPDESSAEPVPPGAGSAGYVPPEEGV